MPCLIVRGTATGSSPSGNADAGAAANRAAAPSAMEMVLYICEGFSPALQDFSVFRLTLQQWNSSSVAVLNALFWRGKAEVATVQRLFPVHCCIWATCFRALA